MNHRVAGFDIARALAILGMVIVNFKIAMNADTGSPLLMSFAHLFEGRASAVFVILAGIGITFMTNKSRVSSDSQSIYKSRVSLIKRGLLLIFIGLLYTPIWQADILHFYGFYFLIASIVFMFNNRTLLLLSAVIVLVFPVLMLFLTTGKTGIGEHSSMRTFGRLMGWLGIYCLTGFTQYSLGRFLLFGMWLGRQDLTQQAVRKKITFRFYGILGPHRGGVLFHKVKYWRWFYTRTNKR